MAKAEQLSLEKAMAGALAMLAAARDDEATPNRKPEERRKTEVILADAGIAVVQIAQILGKKPNTVSKIITRARKGAGSAEGNEDV
jgi:DNA-directed RNA polymerase specialized sigma24 family protein